MRKRGREIGRMKEGEKYFDFGGHKISNIWKSKPVPSISVVPSLIVWLHLLQFPRPNIFKCARQVQASSFCYFPLEKSAQSYSLEIFL